MEIRLLGPVELAGGDGAVPLGGPKERAVLAFLALHAGTVVDEARLIDALWGEAPPRTASRTVQAYVSRLRRALADADPAGEHQLVATGAGYRLDLPPGALDVDRARAELEAARALHDGARRAEALAALRSAERLWRGPALGGIGANGWAEVEAARLDELRLDLLEQRIEAALAVERPGELIVELQALCRQHLTRERLHGLLMLALYRGGRQAEALRAYQDLRSHLVEELGIEPTPSLARLEAQILRHDPALDGTEGDGTEGDGAGGPAPPAAIVALREEGFVGRVEELDALDAARWQARQGRIQVVLLAGEPGIGKTALAAEHALRAAALGDVVLFGRCDEEALAPFQPFVEALAALARSLPADRLRSLVGRWAPDLALLLPDLARHLPEVEGIAPTGDETERYRIFEAVPAVLEALSRQAPVVLVLDDLHWADRPTLQLLQHVIRRSTAARLLVLGSYRDTDLVRTHPMAEALADLRRSGLVRRVLVRGLSAGDIVDLMGGSDDADPATLRLSDELHRQSEGHPLFLREILRHLAETGGIERDAEGTWRARRRLEQLGIPEGVREVIGRRLSRLDEPTNEILRVGSVLGRQLRVDLLERLVDRTPDEVLRSLEGAASAGLVVEEPDAVGRYSFTHALLRQALYAELSTTRRVRLHQRVGEALEALRGDRPGDHLAELAFHFGQSAVAGTAEQAIRYGRLAAEHAREWLAFEEAARHYANALEVAEDLDAPKEERAALLLEMARCHWDGGSPAGARQACERLLALGLDDPSWIASVALAYDGAEDVWLWANLIGLNHRGIELLEQARVALGDDDRDLLARVLAALAVQLTFQDGTEERRFELVDRAMSMARRLGDRSTLATVLNHGCLALWVPRTATERVAWSTEARAAAVEAGDTRLQAFAALHRAFAVAQLNRIHEMEDALAEADALLTARRDERWHSLTIGLRAGRHLLAGEFAAADALAAEGFVLGQDAGDHNRLVQLSGLGVTSMYHQGRLEELFQIFVEGMLALPTMSHYMAFAKFMVPWGRGQTDVAIAELDAALGGFATMRTDPFSLYFQHMVARVAWDLDHRAAAEILRGLLAPFAEHNALMATIGWGPVAISLAWVEAVCGDLDAAEGHLRWARLTCAANGWVVPDVEAALALGEVLRLRGGSEDLREAAALADEVVAAAARLGMAAPLVGGEALRDRLAGGTSQARVGTSTGPATLSLRGRLVRGGRSLLAAWSRGLDDDELIRRFGGPRSQRAIFRALAAAHRGEAKDPPVDIVFQLAAPDDVQDPEAIDWWTVTIGAGRATATLGRVPDPTVTMRLTFPDFIRIAAGEVTAVDLVVGNRVEVVGDVWLALRLTELFGIVTAPA